MPLRIFMNYVIVKVRAGENTMKYIGSRDMQASSAVAVMAQLGRFETEFIIYGSAVQEQDGKIYYYATTNQEKLYRCIKNARLEDRYFMPMVQLVRRMKVPADLEDEWLAKSKLDLIKLMKKQYETYLPRMRAIFLKEPNNEAVGVLSDFQNVIEGYFDDTLLQLFLGLLEMSYEGKILSHEQFIKFKEWHDKVRHQMSDDPASVDNITRIFYGFVYKDKDENYRSIIDAQEMNVVEQRQEKQIQGYLVAPIIKKQFAFKQFGEMPKIRQEFIDWLFRAQSEEYFSLIEELKNLPGVVFEEDLKNIAETFEGVEYAALSTMYYTAVLNKCAK